MDRSTKPPLASVLSPPACAAAASMTSRFMAVLKSCSTSLSSRRCVSSSVFSRSRRVDSAWSSTRASTSSPGPGASSRGMQSTQRLARRASSVAARSECAAARRATYTSGSSAPKQRLTRGTLRISPDRAISTVYSAARGS